MSTDPAELLRLYGTDSPRVAWRTVRAGPLSVDLEAGQLRYIRWHGVEVLRAVSFLVRDEYWGTFVTEIAGLSVEERAGYFEISYHGSCARQAGDFQFEASIRGEASGRLRFEVTGSPRENLKTARVGFVVLHPLAGVVGQPVAVEHLGGRKATVVIPEAISPHEPIEDIFALMHTPAPGIAARVEMTGDAYDMEDQRNWTDASLKTYIRPLSKPWPYVVAAGEVVSQSVTLSLSGQPAQVSAGVRLGLRWSPIAATMPRMGIAVEGGDLASALTFVDQIRALGAGRLIARPRSPADLADFAELRHRLEMPLTLEFAVPGVEPEAELADWAAKAAAAGLSPESVMAIPYRLYPLAPAGVPAGTASLAAIAGAARAAFSGALIGGGVLTAFTEFNRNRPPVGETDYLTHTTSAIVHAADDRSVMESLEALPYVLASVRAIAETKPYRLGPSSIGLALNPNGPPRWLKPGEGRQTMVRNDPRHAGLFGAAWAVGYAARVVGRVQELAIGHATGDFGLLGPHGELRPAYHVVRALCRAQGQALLTVDTGDARLAAFGFAGLAGTEIWLANLTPDRQSIDLPEPATIAVLDATSLTTTARNAGFLDAVQAKSGSLDLPAFAVVRMVLP
jgi:hypothetical protein